MEKQIFTQELDEKLLEVIKIKNQIAEKCMNKVKIRQNVDFSDLSPISVNKEQTSIINKELNLMKNRTLYVMLYFLGSIAFSIKYMFKLKRLNVLMRKSFKTWAFTFLSSSVLFRIYNENLQVNFEKQLEDMSLDHLFDTHNKYENEEERVKIKNLLRNQLDFYKTAKFLK